ncbi:MAG: hydrogenobyrinic acid a,c-diamide synthase (glutamine-hydrolyzing) [Proteobacteria bacterium]|nr:hydrogenobyrinic acid a,c-diamide synthase (glutamine-hydrolyzing) [Pseudomonadota bacterium]
MASLFISAAHKSSGKTTVSIGLCAALSKRGLVVQPFKKGPDYIDPIWLGIAAGRPCYNLDFFTAGKQETIMDFARRNQSADISIIEGNKGLHDGLDLDGSNSNAALAKSLQSPVILVIDARGTMRGIAPLLIGYQVFDPEVYIAGVIVNMTGGSRHESKLRAAVEHYTDIPFLGALGKDSSISLDEQHIGLIPGYEDPESGSKVRIITAAVNNHIDLDRLVEIAGTAPGITTMTSKTENILSFHGITIGIAQDSAFGFYYPGDLDAMRAAGAEIVPINTLTDSELPRIDGLFIGGGFPERYAAELQANTKLRDSIKTAIENGLPAYAECGGLMYLSRSLNWQGKTFDMVGAIPGDTRMHEKSCGRGYVKLEENSGVFPWGSSNNPTALVHAHEFHYSSIEGLPENTKYAYTVRRGSGINQQSDGLIYKNLLASYSHLRNTRATPWIERFLSFVSDKKAA